MRIALATPERPGCGASLGVGTFVADRFAHILRSPSVDAGIRDEPDAVSVWANRNSNPALPLPPGRSTALATIRGVQLEAEK